MEIKQTIYSTIPPGPDYNNSEYIDEDIKELFKNRLYFSYEIPLMQLIKELKKLNKHNGNT